MLRLNTMSLEGFRLLDAGEIHGTAGLPARGVVRLAHTVRADETSALVPHANNIAILGWIDHAAARHGDLAGASRDALAARGRMWFVARHEVDYLGESFAGDELAVVAWAESVGRTSLVRATRVLRRSDGSLLVSARSRWALVDLSTRRPAAIDSTAREYFASATAAAPPTNHLPSE